MTDWSFNPRGAFAANDFLPGPAGTVTAGIGYDLVAEVDVMDSAVLNLTDASFSPDPRFELIESIVQSPDALDAIRRLVTSRVFSVEEPHDDPRWWTLDSVLARLDLEAAVPRMDVHGRDPELIAAVELLRSPTFVVSAERALRVGAVVDAVRRKVPDADDIPTTAELAERELTDLLVTLGPSRDDGVQVDDAARVITLSAGHDLARALSGRATRIQRHSDLEVELIVPCVPSATVLDPLACYLIEPEHDHPLAHASFMVELTDPEAPPVWWAEFRLSREDDDGRHEFVVLPAFRPTASFIKASPARALIAAEIRLRTAVRLAQKSHRSAALAALTEAERAYRDARPEVPSYYRERLRSIRRRIEEDRCPTDLLGDL